MVGEDLRVSLIVQLVTTLRRAPQASPVRRLLRGIKQINTLALDNKKAVLHGV